MLCAWAHPFADKALNAIDELSIRSRMIARSVIFGITAALFAVWCALSALPDEPSASSNPRSSMTCRRAQSCGHEDASRRVHALAVLPRVAASSACKLCKARLVPPRRYQHVFILDKLAYNKLHPFTSWMPILCWIVVRSASLKGVARQ